VSGYAELAAATNFSFLRGASHPSEMVETSLALGHSGIGIADINSVAGVVRAWSALKAAREEGRGTDFKLITGARLCFADDTPDIIAYPQDRAAWGRLTRLLSLGNLRSAKGSCTLYFEDLLAWCEAMALIVLPPCVKANVSGEDRLGQLRTHTKSLWLGAVMLRAGRDKRKLNERKALSAKTHIPLIAINDALYATPDARRLHDILTCIAEKSTITKAGRKLAANAERHLKPMAEMARLFDDCPEAVWATQTLIHSVNFDLGALAYEYPNEPVPPDYTPESWLETLVMQKAHARYPGGIPDKTQVLLDEEFALIGRLKIAAYFLTVHDIVQFAQSRGILCQGRGSAANSAICFILGITAVDPAKYNLLFSRFLSEERNEPPDIDVDFEHERREEVMQYVYQRYGRERAAIATTVIHYRPRSAVREVGKALGLTEDVTARLSSTVWGSYSSTADDRRYVEAGFDPANPEIARLSDLVGQILKFPRHLSQHVGGFVLTQNRLDETVPIHNAAMIDRTFIEWDKDDIDALGLMKVDVLALGMLTCIRKAFAMIADGGGPHYTLDNVPDDDVPMYDMLCKGDSIGVFQVESRGQINMLPRLRPREFYDLAIQVAIVRPGPIQGDMVHPYLRRRQGFEKVEFPAPDPAHGSPDELHQVLGKTLGVPLFQEQAMKLAIVAAKFTGSEANQLRRAMATFRNLGTIDRLRDKLIGGMVARGYETEFAERCFKQIEGFGSYGFPESHAIAFARLVYVSSYLKCHYPAVFAAALLNSQPMGFYAPAQIVRDAREHGVDVEGIDANLSGWDNEANSTLRLGLRQIEGFRRVWAETIAANRPFTSIEDIARRTEIPARALRLLADADAFRSIGLDRRAALWEVRRTPTDILPLFAAADARELADEPAVDLPVMQLGEHVAADYQTTRMSLKAHPMALLRPIFAREGVLTCAEVERAKNGQMIKCAGVVLVRQRPGKGNAIFITLEDETGVANLLLWARVFEAQRRAVMASRLMLVEAEVQRSPEGVVHLMTSRIHDRSAELMRLSDIHEAQTPLARADEALRPPPPRRSGHPRNVRILPSSRDFH
jgi:error-prone DNA polymerase